MNRIWESKNSLPGVMVLAALAVARLAVRDWPTFPWRGRYFDGSQYLGTVVPTRVNQPFPC